MARRRRKPTPSELDPLGRGNISAEEKARNRKLTAGLAARLGYGDTLYHRKMQDSRGDPVKVRVSGRPKTWATRPGQVEVPVKHGMYENLHIGNTSGSHAPLDDFSLSEEAARRKKSTRR